MSALMRIAAHVDMETAISMYAQKQTTGMGAGAVQIQISSQASLLTSE
jgi:hypothetical protein